MNDSARRILIGLPAYNEEIAIERLLQKIEFLAAKDPREYAVVVYDDGSTDKTREIAATWRGRQPIIVLGHAENRGLGYGLAILMRYAVDHSALYDVLIVMDCDDTHDPAQIPAMLREMDQGSEIVIASRYQPGASVVGVPLFRRISAIGAMILLKIIHPIKGAFDYTCGYRAYSVALLKRADERFGDRLIVERGFACMVELLLKLSQFSPIITEIPLQLRYDLKPTETKMQVSSHIRRLLRLVIGWRLHGFAQN